MAVGVLIATWRERRRGRPVTSGSLTDLALDHGLRAQIKRLDEEGRRLRAERNELLAVLARLADLLDHGSEHRQASALSHARGPTEEHSSSPGRTPDLQILLKRTRRSVTPLAILVASKDNGTLYPEPRVIQLPATIHLFGSKKECVTAICDIGGPPADQDGPG